MKHRDTHCLSSHPYFLAWLRDSQVLRAIRTKSTQTPTVDLYEFLIYWALPPNFNPRRSMCKRHNSQLAMTTPCSPAVDNKVSLFKGRFKGYFSTPDRRQIVRPSRTVSWIRDIATTLSRVYQYYPQFSQETIIFNKRTLYFYIWNTVELLECSENSKRASQNLEYSQLTRRWKNPQRLYDVILWIGPSSWRGPASHGPQIAQRACKRRPRLHL